MAEPDPPYVPPYDPDLVAAIRQARADLYEAQAARRRRYLTTGQWTPQVDPRRERTGDDPDPRDVPPAASVDMRRADLDTARELAAASVPPPPPVATKGASRAHV
jgi:hypothetical protein